MPGERACRSPRGGKRGGGGERGGRLDKLGRAGAGGGRPALAGSGRRGRVGKHGRRLGHAGGGSAEARRAKAGWHEQRQGVGHSAEPNGLATGAGRTRRMARRAEAGWRGRRRAGSGWLWGAREGSDKTSKDGGSPMNKHAEIHAAWPVVCSYLDVNLTRRPAHVWRTRANAPHPSRPPTAPPPDEKHDPNVQNPGQRQDAIAAHGRRGCSARKRSPATTGPTRGLARAAVAVAARAPEAGPPGPRSPSAPHDRTSPVQL